MSETKTPVGGGVKKILYTLQTAQRIGLASSARALTARNTCKACGLGMGGQAGGMTNELGEFPAVCNKSVQAQSTDIQAPIPEAVFAHGLREFQQLSARELEHLGRLGTPLYKAGGSERFDCVDWSWALAHAARQFAATDPQRSFFYASGRSSNEAGFVLQLLARMYGTHNVNNCSYYCHQATGVGLANTIGTGTATVELADLEGCDLIFVIGANPASNHPRLIHKLKACRDRGGQVVVINPAREPGLVRFALPKSARSLIAGGSEIASHYLQPRIGSDLALLKGLCKAVLAQSAQDERFLREHTLHYDEFRADIDQTNWHSIERATGLGQAQIEAVAAVYAESANAVFAWGMGVTHHRNGVENVEYISNLALLRGMVGRPHRGLLPLRGHSNVQGIGTIGVKPVLAPQVFEAMQERLGVAMAAPQRAGMDTLACLEAAASGDIDAALIMGGNLFEATPNRRWAGDALDRIGFKLYLTTTLNAGHVQGANGAELMILPVAARDEEPAATTQESMFNFVRLSDGGIGRIAGARSEIDILVDLAERLELGKNSRFDIAAFRSRSSIRQAIASVVPGMEALADIDVAMREFHVRNRLLHRPAFNTESGKAGFVVHPLRPVEAGGDFPFTLMTVRSEGQFNSIIYEQHDSYRGIDRRWSVMLNRADMARLGLEKGSLADLESAHGAMRAVTVYPFDLPEGNAMAYYPEANRLTGPACDPRSRTPAFKSVAINIVPHRPAAPAGS